MEVYIRQFGERNRHLAAGKNKTAAWFVSHCATQARREMYVKQMKKHLEVDVYGKCGKLTCSRTNETECFINLEKSYKELFRYCVQAIWHSRSLWGWNKVSEYQRNYLNRHPVLPFIRELCLCRLRDGEVF